ncbi:cytochrome P450 2F2-like [Aplysia californica]|uniref:Cytochrome P450 2F2-like n=1 Tax=Aplysia californica TaxID=6500 RepID=A0ABM0JTQ4_APLCA|nr:cytochrome P450 2F2-like [Aplysia californica]
METAVTVAILFTLLAVGGLLLSVRPVLLPPGPRLLPLLGNLHLLIWEDVRSLVVRLRKEYGDIFSVYFGWRPVVVVAGLKLIKETFVKNAEVFSERPRGLGYEPFTRGRGIMNTSGEAWKQQRNFVITALHDLGMGSEAMETKIGPEMIQLTSTLLDLNGKSFDPHDIMLVTASNVVFNVCFGKRFEKDDPEFSIFAKRSVV